MTARRFGLGLVLAAILGVGMAASVTVESQTPDQAPETSVSVPELRPYVPPASVASGAASNPAQSAPERSSPDRPAVTRSKPVPNPVPNPAPKPAAVMTGSRAASSVSTSAPAQATGSAATVPASENASVTTPGRTSVVINTPRTPRTPSTVPPVAAAWVSTPISPEDIETFTDSVVRTLMQRDHVLGTTVAIVQGNTPLLVKGYGYDRLSPLRAVEPANSLFRLGSISKAFTWIVARQEVEAGRIKPDASIGDYLPADIYSEDRRYKPITLTSLMDHTGGYEDTSLGHLFQLSTARLVASDSYFRVHRPKRVRAPGQFSSYSNFGAALVARAVQQTAHAKDVPSLMEARIFQPLGMAHTTLREPYSPEIASLEGLPEPISDEMRDDLSAGFIWDGAAYEAQPFDHAVPLAAAVGASSTAQDMARFMSLLLNNGQMDGIQLFNADSAAAFRRPMLNVPEGYNGWASGLMIGQAPAGFTTYGHDGATLWFNANLILVPEMNLGIFISTNTQTGNALATSFPDLLLDHLKGDLVRPPLMPKPANSYARNETYYQAIEGDYVSTRRAYSGLEGAITRLLNTVSVSLDADGRLILTTQNGLSAFVPASAKGFFTQQDAEDTGPARQTGGLHFLFNANGDQVSAFETAKNLARYERIDWIHRPSVLAISTGIMLLSCLLVWIGAARGPSRQHQPSEDQGRATVISSGLSLLWVVAIGLFFYWRSQMADDPVALFTNWPSGQVRLASALAFVAALGTLYQTATYYFVMNDRGRYGVGWALWQKLAHGVMLLFWLFYIVVLTLWGALEPWSW
ncbi:MAG: serine hydrolase [Asticcacaulis sp.]